MVCSGSTREGVAAPATLKAVAFRWMNAWIVEVLVSKEKPVDGIERSCTSRHVRRKRGLRKGKQRPPGRRLPALARARGGKPRLLAGNRQPLPRSERSRPFNRALRTFDFWDAKRDLLVKQVRETPRDGWLHDGQLSRRALWLRGKVHAFNRGCTRVGEGAGILRSPFTHLVEKHCGVVLPGTLSAVSVLRGWLQDIRSRQPPTQVEEDRLVGEGSAVLRRRIRRFCRHCGCERMDDLVEIGFCQSCRSSGFTSNRAPLGSGRYKKRGTSKRNHPVSGNFVSAPERKQTVPGGCPTHPWSRMRQGVCRLCQVNFSHSR